MVQGIGDREQDAHFQLCLVRHDDMTFPVVITNADFLPADVAVAKEHAIVKLNPFFRQRIVHDRSRRPSTDGSK